MPRVSNLNKHFGELPIFENFDLRPPCKGFIVLIGPSGYGKSTLFNVLTGVVAKESGEISRFDETISHLWDRSVYIGFKCCDHKFRVLLQLVGSGF
jgi:ABC-type sugar transport system ATPase subunit